MKSSRLRGVAWVWLLALSTCGGGDFSDDFAQEIQRDCFETVACQPSVGPVGECVTRTGGILDEASTSQQQYFVDTVVRCQLNQSCLYVTCTQQGAATGFAAAKAAEIAYECEQRAQCRIAGGTPLTTDWLMTCIAEQGTALNADPNLQPAFEGRFTRCAGKLSCDWTACQ
ncbi:MAG: hypothetical protein ABW321_28265 [Polyangiales bacterium]